MAGEKIERTCFMTRESHQIQMSVSINKVLVEHRPLFTCTTTAEISSCKRNCIVGLHSLQCLLSGPLQKSLPNLLLVFSKLRSHSSKEQRKDFQTTECIPVSLSLVGLLRPGKEDLKGRRVVAQKRHTPLQLCLGQSCSYGPD